MSESEVERMMETLYGENGLLVAVSQIKGGVQVLVWMVGTGLVVIGMIIAYLGYVATSHEAHAIMVSHDPSFTSSRLGDRQ